MAVGSLSSWDHDFFWIEWASAKHIFLGDISSTKPECSFNLIRWLHVKRLHTSQAMYMLTVILEYRSTCRGRIVVAHPCLVRALFLVNGNWSHIRDDADGVWKIMQPISSAIVGIIMNYSTSLSAFTSIHRLKKERYCSQFRYDPCGVEIAPETSSIHECLLFGRDSRIRYFLFISMDFTCTSFQGQQRECNPTSSSVAWRQGG